MGLFGNKREGGLMDVIRCDETDYLIWKWRPNGGTAATSKENAIRWGSSLRVKDGEVAVFVYSQESGPNQEFIEGPFDDTLKTSNLPLLTGLLGRAFDGKSPFQAEIYFINLAGTVKVNFRVPYFDVFDPRFQDFPVRTAVAGAYIFNLTNYRAFIKLHRLIGFELSQFTAQVRDALFRYVKAIVANTPAEHGIAVLQIERKLLEINDLVTPRIRQAFAEDFGVNLVRLDLSAIEIDKETEEYRQLRQITGDLEIRMRGAQNELSIKNLADTQALNRDNLAETLRIQREQAERLAALQTQSQYLGAHQMNLQADVLRTAAENLGTMAQTGGGANGGGFNPVGMMAGMAVGGVMGNQIAGMMNTAGQATQPPGMMPPPPPVTLFHVSLNGQTSGPFSLAQFAAMAAGGQVNAASLVWKPGMVAWEPAVNVPELAAALQAPGAPVPPPIPPQAV